MKTHHRALVLAASGLTLVLAAGCSGDPSPTTGPASTATPVPATSSPSSPADDATSSPTGDDSSPSSSDGASDDSAPAAGTDAALLAAVALAEQEAGGVAHEVVDRDDDGSWEIHVAVGGGPDEVEVHVSADGTQVLRTEREDGLDSDEVEALAAATTTLAAAIEAARAAVGGSIPVEDVDLEREDGRWVWEVGFDDDVDVHVAVDDGSVVSIDR